MYRHDRNCFGGGVCMYVNHSIPVKRLNSHKDDSKTLFLQINLHLRKWLLVGVYKPPDQRKSISFKSFSKSLTIYLDTYENVILLGDKNLQIFADSFNLEHPI